jgi:hypothetical protein
MHFNVETSQLSLSHQIKKELDIRERREGGGGRNFIYETQGCNQNFCSDNME